MLTDYSVLISESYDGQHKLLTEELKRNGTKSIYAVILK